MSTLVYISQDTPAPWSHGNCFELRIRPARRRERRLDRGYHVANMHFENFREVVRQMGLKVVEVEVADGCFLVVDSRIPRRWMKESPCTRCARIS